MEIIAGIFLVLIGGTMLIKPKAIWKVSESWKTKAEGEPTELYIMMIRIGGCILVIGGICAILQM